MKPHLKAKAQPLLAALTVLIAPCADHCFAGVVCAPNSGNTKHVCVVWSQQADPEEGSDFLVDYQCTGCADAPNVELRAADWLWNIYSEVISTGAPANLGALTTTDAQAM